MSAERTPTDMPDPQAMVLSYEVDTTTILYGLPPYERLHVLRAFKKKFLESSGVKESRVGNTVFDLSSTYDISCQWHKNEHTMHNAGTHTDSDVDSIFSSDGSVPPLQSVEPSEKGASPPVATAEASPEATGEASEPVDGGEPSPAIDMDSSSDGVAVEEEPDAPFSWSSGFDHYWEILGLGMNRSPAGGIATAVPVPAFVPASQVWQGDLNGWTTVDNEARDWTRLATGENTERPGWGLTDGEAVERAWAHLPGSSASSTREMGAGERRDTLQGDDNGNSNFHRLRIIALRGVRDVECDCIDGAHAEHSRVTQYAFLDSSANVVIKKSKTLLLPLNY